MPSGPEQAADAARKAKGLPATPTPEQYYGGIVARELATAIVKEINKMSWITSWIGSIAASISPTYAKGLTAILSNIVAFFVGSVLAWAATKGLATCTPDPLDASHNVCTLSLLGFSWTDVQIDAWIIGIVMTIVNGHAVIVGPANKPA